MGSALLTGSPFPMSPRETLFITTQAVAFPPALVGLTQLSLPTHTTHSCVHSTEDSHPSLKTYFQGQLLGRYRDNEMGGLAVLEKAGTALGIPKGKVLEPPWWWLPVQWAYLLHVSSSTEGLPTNGERKGPQLPVSCQEHKHSNTHARPHLLNSSPGPATSGARRGPFRVPHLGAFFVITRAYPQPHPPMPF